MKQGMVNAYYVRILYQKNRISHIYLRKTKHKNQISDEVFRQEFPEQKKKKAGRIKTPNTTK